MRKDLPANPDRRYWRKNGGRIYGWLPPPYRGVSQRIIAVHPDRPLADQLPARCPKCQAAALVVERIELHCTGRLGGCGAVWQLVSGDPVDLDWALVRGRYRGHYTPEEDEED